MLKRNDAVLCNDIPVFNRIFPYVMPTRVSSLLMHEMQFDLTKAAEFVKEYNHKLKKSEDYATRLSSVIVAAIVRTIAERPKVNRFIASHETWQRNELSINFIVRKSMDEDDEEISEPMYFPMDGGTFVENNNIIEGYIERALNTKESVDELQSIQTMEKLLKFCPRWFLRCLARHFIRSDERGHGVPKWLRDTDGLHVSCFVSNLGSIGLKTTPVHHHLYIWGTTSLFCTLGPLNTEPVLDEAGKRTGFKRTMNFGWTVDDRICDGLYFVNTVNLVQHYLDHPLEMLERSKKIPPFYTAKQAKADAKKRKQQIKKMRAEAKRSCQAK